MPQIWALKPVIAVPQRYCLFAQIDRTGVPFARIRDFTSLQLARLSPFEVTGSHVELGSSSLLIWYWNGALAQKGAPPRQAGDAWYIPEQRLLQGSESSLVQCPLGGFTGSAQSAEGRVRKSQWWSESPTAAQWAGFSANVRPTPTKPGWRKLLGVSSTLGALWWQKRRLSDREGLNWMVLAVGLVVFSAAGWLGFQATTLHLSQQSLTALSSEVKSSRESARSQLALQQQISELASDQSGMERFVQRDSLGNTIACLGLNLAEIGVTLRDIDIRAGSLQATLAAESAIELEISQKQVERCEMLKDVLVEPSSEAKSAKLNARVVAADLRAPGDLSASTSAPRAVAGVLR